MPRVVHFEIRANEPEKVVTGADPKKLDMKQCDKLTSSGTSTKIKISRGGPKWPSATHLNSSFKSSWKS